MQGISIKLDISEQFLRNINDISDSIYPGMVLNAAYLDHKVAQRYRPEQTGRSSKKGTTRKKKNQSPTKY